MAEKVVPTYEGMKHTGVACTGGTPAPTLTSYQALKLSGVSTASQPENPMFPDPTPAHDESYNTLTGQGGPDMSGTRK